MGSKKGKLGSIKRRIWLKNGENLAQKRGKFGSIKGEKLDKKGGNWGQEKENLAKKGEISA